ncbi:dihydrolipoamide acetyltransferase family protein [Jeotgalibacillus marinus]|uniref:Dihydrolipoamide acetyltransferase component of pyruvate dehydrogenase complex n=1 Tax=Jeotgalibacillus marinus TaxID=86667 RepID=A0ABV3Q2E2_9BACL
MKVKLHDIGEGMTQADINHFFVEPGDVVKADDPLVEVQTDKMTAEIPAPTSGTIKEIKVERGSTVAVGTTVMILEPQGTFRTTRSIDKKVEKKVSNREAEGQFKPSHSPKRILAAPYTRKIARENDIKIEQVNGTGPANRITDEDVYSFINGSSQSATDVPMDAPVKTDDQASPKTIPYKGMRKQIGKKMVQSLFTIPHCTHFEEIDVTELISLRKQLKKQGKSVSATIFFMKALTICLKEFPLFNASLDEENETIFLYDECHIGLATDTSEGLIVPVMKNVEKKSFAKLQLEMKELIDKATNQSLTLQECKGSTFTISNVGPLGGSTGATPIINAPEVGLMAFHKTKKRPVVNEQDEIVVRSMMNISMSYDHRVVDGASAVAFTNRFTELIENPTLLVVELM